MPSEFDLLIIDDSGLLGLVDCAAYNSFVAEDWEYEQLMRHFASEMTRRSILVWDCGDGGDDYRIRIRNQITAQTGWRETLGEIRATGEQFHLASYTALTMCAQFNDYHLPEKHESNLVVPVSPGLYRVRIVQMYDPAKAGNVNDDEPHFLVELERGDGPSWSEAAWRAA
ncbi:MAG: hypothetical protein ING77_17380 [Rhodocyclaceae bacterium]|nr:hypothetical protein [Rhodocyclaceae bacterium]MCA3593414.1 hypothetical protein [Methylocystis sp.]